MPRVVVLFQAFARSVMKKFVPVVLKTVNPVAEPVMLPLRRMSPPLL